MGTSRWTYFVPYREDIGAALRELHEDVFRSGQYFDPRTPLRELLKQTPPRLTGAAADSMAATRARIEQRVATPDPKSVDELRALCGSSRTHTVIDMEGVSKSAREFRVAPLSERQLLSLFGTARPTRTQAESAMPEVLKVRRHGYGTYIILYDGDRPSEILFAGYSGD